MRLQSVAFSRLRRLGVVFEEVHAPPSLFPIHVTEEKSCAHFREARASAGVLKDLACLGPFQMMYVWLATLKSTEAKRRLLVAGQLQVKNGHCYALDPCEAEVRLKIHRVHRHVPDDTLRRALDGFGRMEWRMSAVTSGTSRVLKAWRPRRASYK